MKGVVDINTVCVTGRLTKDVEYNAETEVARFSIAVNREFKNKDGKYESDFFDVTAFKGSAGFASKFLSKGIKVEIVGNLRQDRWETKEGEKRSRIIIVASSITFAESKSTSQKNTAPPVNADKDGFLNVPSDLDSEVPFA